MGSGRYIAGRAISDGTIDRARGLRERSTPAEKALWNHLRDKKVLGFHFRRQQPIRGFYADFYCDALGLVLELDGSIHENQVRYDAERDAIFSALGLKVWRVPNDAVVPDPRAFLRTLREWMRKELLRRATAPQRHADGS